MEKCCNFAAKECRLCVMRDFTAIDFETANNERTSVCSVGVVILE